MKRFSLKKLSLTVLFSVFISGLFAQTFSEQTGITLSGISNGTSLWGDADNDGDIDILISGYDNSNILLVKLYRNNGSNAYSDAGNIFSPALPGTYGNYTMSVQWVDFDNDGFLDILLNTTTLFDVNNLMVYHHEADHSYLLKSTIEFWAWQGNAAECGDYDNDGDQDILLVTNNSSKIFQNQGNFSFREQYSIRMNGLLESTGKFVDFDNDGDLDIYFMGTAQATYTPAYRFYENNGDNSFTLNSGVNLHGFFDGSADWGDYNNDGFTDLLITGKYGTSKIYKNNGNKSFTPQSAISLIDVSESSGKWGDFDNDGDLDIIISGNSNNVFYTKIYTNNGNNTFSELTGTIFEGVYKSSLDLGDYDNDRDLDVLISGDKGGSRICKVYKNLSTVNNPVPAAPTGLSVASAGNNIILKWNSVRTDNTPYKALTYNVMVGTSSGGVNIVSPNSASDGYHRISGMGNGQTDTTFILKNIPKGVTYYWKVQAIDNGWKGSSFTSGPNFTYTASVQASYLNAPAIDGITATLTWSRGNGSNCVVFLKEANTGTAIPSNGSTYTGSSIFKSGSQIGATGWFCVYNGSGTSVNVTNLSAKKDYIFQAFEYTGSTYDLSASAGNPYTFKTGSFTELKSAVFLPVSALAVLYPTSSFWVDIDNDAGNDLDLILFGANASRIYRNEGAGNFTELSSPFGTGFSAACGDYNNDGLIDVAVAVYPEVRLFKNTGGGTFAEQSGALPVTGQEGTLDWGDYNNDGDLDILITGSSSVEGRFSKIFKNNGDNTFTELQSVSLEGLSYGSAKWTDYDNDSFLDLILSGSANDASSKTKIYRNTGNNSFTEQKGIAITGTSNGSIDWGDFDNDGDQDLIITGFILPSSITKIYRNDGNNSFTELPSTGLPNVNNGTAKWGDYDADGYLDILITGYSGYFSQHVTKIFKNNGNGTFTEDLTSILPQAGVSSGNWGDYDKDGDLDIMITGNTENAAILKIYRNDLGLINLSPAAPTGLTSTVTMSDVALKWKSIRSDNTPYKAMTYNLRVGTAPGTINVLSPNSSSSGLRRIVTPGNMEHDTTFLLKKLPFGVYYWSVQAVDNGFTGSAFSSEGTFTVSPVQANSLSASTINSNSIILKWKRGNGDRCVVFAKQSSTGQAVPVNNTGYVADPEVGFGSQIGTSGWYCIYNGRADSVIVSGLIASKQYSFHIIEYMGTFGTEQYFTVTADGNPGVFSTSRFTDQTAIILKAGYFNNVVWGDYDNDGFNDILIPGFPTRIYRNKGDNTFEEKTAISITSINYGSAEWGDYDSDGDLDIIITGTSNASTPITSPVTKIYRNDGGDVFTEQTSISLIQLFYSSAAWGDYDNDGDLDILLNGAYGTSPNFTPVSKIYENTGNNTFTEQTQVTLTGLYRGSVRWVDYDNDGDLDIVMTGALMETQFNTEGIFKLYRNNGNKTFTEQTLDGVTILSSNSATSWGDFDNDGDLDFMITAQGFMSLYKNLGGNSFNNLWSVSLAYQGSAYAAWGDYDNDGFLDIILSNPGLDTKIYRNTHGLDDPGSLTPWFNKQDDDAVKSIGYSFVNWIDYDNDGDLDFLMSKDSGLPTKIFRNNLIMRSGKFNPNTSPAAPSGQKSVNSPTGVVLSWNPVQNDQTPSKTMSYNIRIGSSKSLFNISPPHSSSTGHREVAAIGNAQLDTTFLLINMPAIKYYWSVQAVDQGLKGGAWSPTDSVDVKNVLSFFSADTVCEGLSTQFTNQSVAFGDVIQSYKWLFGDGATSTLENPTHLFSTAGVKNVTLIAISASRSDTLSKPIIVKARPLVDFSATVACQGSETELQNLSVVNALTITSWSWDYGDGKGSTAMEPGTHGYLSAGDYQVKLTANADNQCSSFITKTVSVGENPVASISATGLLSFCDGDSIILNVPYTKNYTYQWILNNTGQPNSDTSRFAAKLTGEYKVYVLNPLGNCDTTSLPVSVNAKPIPFKPTISSLNYQEGQCPPIDTKIKLTLSPEMTGYNYQWFRNGTPYSNGTLHILEDYLPQGNYSVESNLNGCKSVSDNYTLSYAAAPEIPKLNAKGPTVWYLATQFKSYKYYRWYFNDQIISGANKYIYVANKRLGTYRVEVANENLCYTSSADKIIPASKSGMSDFTIPIEYIVSGENDAASEVKVYPNPGNGLFNIEFNNEQRGELTISVFRVDGTELLSIKSIKDSDEFRYQINLTGRPAGNYLIKINLNNISTVKKIIIE